MNRKDPGTLDDCGHAYEHKKIAMHNYYSTQYRHTPNLQRSYPNNDVQFLHRHLFGSIDGGGHLLLMLQEQRTNARTTLAEEQMKNQ